MNHKHTSKNKILAAHHGGGPGGQGGAQQGTGARGEQYLDGPDLRHTLARRILFASFPHACKQTHNNKTLLLSVRFFEASPVASHLTHVPGMPGVASTVLLSGNVLYVVPQ